MPSFFSYQNHIGCLLYFLLTTYLQHLISSGTCFPPFLCKHQQIPSVIHFLWAIVWITELYGPHRRELGWLFNGGFKFITPCHSIASIKISDVPCENLFRKTKTQTLNKFICKKTIFRWCHRFSHIKII